MQRAICRGIFAPAQPDFLAASVRDFLSGAYIRIDDVAAGVRDAIDRGVIGFDAVKHLVLCRIERRPPRLDMRVYPYLPHASVALTSARTYMDLLTGVAS